MNIIDQLIEELSKGSRPNSLTLEMGEAIRKAREEKKLSQRELAPLIYRRQAALSEIENGLMEPDAETLLMLSLILEKPLAYFFPKKYRRVTEISNLTDLESELLVQARRLSEDDLKRINAQVKALCEL
jgi:transcriptional regulator with XRE-family HTH domain